MPFSIYPTVPAAYKICPANLLAEQFCQLVLVQFGTDDTDLAGDFRLTASDVMFFGNIIIIYPGSVGSRYHTLGTQDSTVLSAVQSGKDLLNVLCAVSVGCLDTPAGEHFVCMMVMMVVMVMTTAGAVLVMFMMMLMVMVFVMIVMMVMLMLVLIMVMMVVMFVLVLIIVVMMSAAALVIMVIMIMVVMMMFVVMIVTAALVLIVIVMDVL